jgi:hypothetical protein
VIKGLKRCFVSITVLLLVLATASPVYSNSALRYCGAYISAFRQKVLEARNSLRGPMTAVIVDCYSTGNHYPELLRQMGVKKLVHLQSAPEIFIDSFRESFRPEVFDINIIHRGNYNETLKALKGLNVSLVIIGSEAGPGLGAEIARELSIVSNSTKNAKAWVDKGLMAEVLEQKGVPAMRQKVTSDFREAMEWMKATDLELPIIFKPVAGSGTDDVYIVRNRHKADEAFEKVKKGYSTVGEVNNRVLVQEFLKATEDFVMVDPTGRSKLEIEFAVNTVSYGGVHVVSDFWQNIKELAPVGSPIYYQNDLLPLQGRVQSVVTPYLFRVLDAQGIRYGPAHAEVKIVKRGPILIEIGVRLQGSKSHTITGTALGRSQPELAVMAYRQPLKFLRLAQQAPPALREHASLVFFSTYQEGRTMSPDMKQLIELLPTVERFVPYFEPGAPLPITYNIDTPQGVAILRSPDRDAIDQDIKLLRAWQRQGQF